MPVFIIVIAVFLGGSLWFSVNGVADKLTIIWNLTNTDLGYLTAAVQFGFIFGTLSISLTGFADRHNASIIFFGSCLIGATSNAAFALLSDGLTTGLIYRFITGFALAGIYPLGMKLIISWDPKKTGTALGWLVGMLTLGTALPHLIRFFGENWNWQLIILISSLLAVIGGILVGKLGSGPHLPTAKKIKKQSKFNVFSAFTNLNFRSAALGYFGHMWELYAFWTITPLLVSLILSQSTFSSSEFVALISFSVIGVGAIGCIVGGYLSSKFGSAKIAATALFCSGLICFLFPFIQFFSPTTLIGILLFWGIMVVADSPQFSSISAKNCKKEILGSALSIQNCIGFFITILSINLVSTLVNSLGAYVTWLLLPGPILGLFFMRQLILDKKR